MTQNSLPPVSYPDNFLGASLLIIRSQILLQHQRMLLRQMLRLPPLHPPTYGNRFGQPIPVPRAALHGMQSVKATNEIVLVRVRITITVTELASEGMKIVLRNKPSSMPF